MTELFKSDVVKKKVLTTLLSLNLEGNWSLQSFLLELGLGPELGDALLEEAVRSGLVRMSDHDRLVLTPDGRISIKVVMAGGVFDILHPGHIYTLSKARALGDMLVVSVARDKTVLKMRGKPVMNSEETRLSLVRSLRFVDAALLGSENDIFETVELIRPDIIALGYDQAHDEQMFLKKGAERGLKFLVTRLDSPIPGLKSTNLKKDQQLLKSL
ncbi:MAG TPA: adenylyltransferase/cytidyltransferase family protein [Conexivisphaerales archaeon]|nr:adenylyltransferase/cytidyltransferase family protein [Conexivisphaerales archaeon]